jgi:hypothetical protein
MAIIKVYFRKSAKKLIEYVEREGKPGDPVSAIGCDPESAASDFAATKRASGSKGKNEALHVIQSWGEEESKKHPAGFFNELGQKLVEEYFKGCSAPMKIGHQRQLKTDTFSPLRGQWSPYDLLETGYV